MARPKTTELTSRELEIMHVFWEEGELTIADVRDRLEQQGRSLAHTTVATLVRILVDKGFLQQTNEFRQFTFQSVRTFEEVSKNFVKDLVERVFSGSREQLLVHLLGSKKLTKKERKYLEDFLSEDSK